MGSEAIPESWRPALEPVLARPEARRLGGWLSAEEAKDYGLVSRIINSHADI